MSLDPSEMWEQKEKVYQDHCDKLEGYFSIGDVDHHLGLEPAGMRYGLFGVDDIGTNVGMMLGKEKISAVMLLGATRNADNLRAEDCQMKKWLSDEVFNEHVHYLSSTLEGEELKAYQIDGKLPAVRQFLSAVDVVVIQANQVIQVAVYRL
jgi:hypothetical protein